MRRAVMLGGLFGLWLVVAGCGKSAAPPTATEPQASAGDRPVADGGASPAEEAPDPAEPLAPPDPPPPDPALTPTVTLLDPGEEPLAERRYSVQKGARERLRLTMAMDVAVTAEGRPPNRGVLPPIALTVSLVVEDVSEAGAITYRFEVEELGFEGTDDLTGLAAALAGELEGLSSARGEVTVDAQGRVRRADHDAPDGGPGAQVRGAFRDALTQLAVPLPEAPIGQGARWEVRQPTRQGGVVVAQRAVHELRTVEGDRLDLGLRVSQQAEGAPEADTPGRVRRFEGMGEGTARVTTARLSPLTYELALDTAMAFDADAGDAAVAMEMEVALRLSVAAAEEEGGGEDPDADADGPGAPDADDGAVDGPSD